MITYLLYRLIKWAFSDKEITTDDCIFYDILDDDDD